MRRRAPTLTALLLVLLLSACGRERIPVPDAVRPAVPRGVEIGSYPEYGVSFQAPGGWGLRKGPLPLLSTANSGSAVIAVWRYDRAEPLPRSRSDVDAARNRLVEAIKIRDKTFEVASSRRTKVDGAPAVEVAGTGTIEGNRRRIRSTHVYAKGSEVIVDTYAAPEDFDRVDRAAFRPVVDSLKIDPPAG